MATEGDIRVSVPARPDFVHVVRSVMASVAARLDLPYDAIDDLRIAVDEACAQLLEAGGAAEVLTLAITPSDDRVEIVVCTDGEVSQWPAAGLEESLTWKVLAALTEAPRYERWQGNPAVRLVKSVIPQPAVGD